MLPGVECSTETVEGIEVVSMGRSNTELEPTLH
jgi:hypothetical protein